MPSISGDALVDALEAWAASELGLARAPPRAALAELARPPRAAALLHALVSRARAPEHVAAARAAAALRPAPPDPSLDAQREALQRARSEADRLEAEVEVLRAKARRRPMRRAQNARRRAAEHAVEELQNAFADALLEERRHVEHVATALHELEALSGWYRETKVEEHGEKLPAEDEVFNVLDAVARTGVKNLSGEAWSKTADEALEKITAVAESSDVAAVLEVLTKAADEDLRLCSAGDNDKDFVDPEICLPGISARGISDVDGVVWSAADVRARQMDIFIQAQEEAICVREVEARLEEELRTENDAEGIIVLAELAGEQAALVEAERIERAIRMCTSREAVEQRKEIDFASSIASRASSANAELAMQSAALDRLARQRHASLRSVKIFQRALSDELTVNAGDVCHLVAEAGIGLGKTVRHNFDLIMRPLTDVCEHRVSFGDSHLRAAFENCIDESCDIESDFANLEDARCSEQDVKVAELHVEAAQLELDSSKTTMDALKSRMQLILDVFRRDQEAQSSELGNRLDKATGVMQDCVQRLVPSAMRELRMLRMQPGRDCAPWLKANSLCPSSSQRSKFRDVAKDSTDMSAQSVPESSSHLLSVSREVLR